MTADITAVAVAHTSHSPLSRPFAVRTDGKGTKTESQTPKRVFLASALSYKKKNREQSAGSKKALPKDKKE